MAGIGREADIVEVAGVGPIAEINWRGQNTFVKNIQIGRNARTTFFFDGGCRPNPGVMEAAVVSRGQTYFRDDLGSGDSNQAEWLALLYAVELAVTDGALDALFIGDSTLVVEQAHGRWPCRSSHLQPYVAAFKDAVAAIPRVWLRQVPRSKNLAGIALARRGLP